ncbi:MULTISPECIES: acyl-CoA dehydrogenase family protein [unclassified Pseudonocardia]|uniref:acyl-CoA dehydrogenase family protein n=1 Tax=unclassified Pseudonocardia TaxID=2619320 RepID=UPI0001FFE7A8|nr:acyl-CoA dehydrogenase family protein [Pseudonocardia sp. Ae707_Ps1]OLM09253.1 Butyryl-CoA dehydrogenase [Pseudonocardia sp. Ae707_Ps1]
MQMRAGEIGSLAAEGLRDVLGGILGGSPITDYAEAEPLDWEVLRDGGWDELGVPEEAGGAGASLRDLTEVALAWGAYCAPSPLIETILAKRWSAAARDQAGPVTVAVPAVGGGAVAPFGAVARVLSGLGAGPDGFLDPPQGLADAFALTLRPVPCAIPTVFADEAARELAVLWAAEGVGAARRCLLDAVEYAKGRKQFGVPIGSFQAIKHRAAHTLELTERAETAVLWAAADSYTEGAESIGTRRLLLHALSTSQEVVESCIQIHGGMGFTWEMGVHVYLRHVITLREFVDELLPGATAG